MAAVRSITASTTLTSLATHSSRWYNRSVTVLVVAAGIAAIAYVAYQLFFNRAEASLQQHDEEVADGCIATFYPDCANATHDLPFDNIAAGIFRVNQEDIRNGTEPVFITCIYQNEPYFRQPMTLEGRVLEAMVPELPEGEEVTIQIMHRDTVRAQINLHVDREMSIYEIIKNGHQWNAEPHPHALPVKLAFKKAEEYNFDNPFSLILHDDCVKFDGISRSRNISCSLINMGTLVHILFFEVLGRNAADSETYALPVVVLPEKTKDLPRDFLATSWETTFRAIHKQNPPNNLTFEVLSITDTTSEPEI